MKLNKGAMFGLDARIALAIFGALSVISGAALYSAIKQAKITAEITQMDEYSKALSQYMLDTGGDLPFATGMSAATKELISSKADGWKGPYIDGSVYGANYIKHPKYKWLTIDYAPNKSFSYSPSIKTCSDASNAGEACYYWLVFSEVPDQMVIGLEAAIDGDADPENGKFRYAQGGRPAGTKIVYYRLHPTIKKY